MKLFTDVPLKFVAPII